MLFKLWFEIIFSGPFSKSYKERSICRQNTVLTINDMYWENSISPKSASQRGRRAYAQAPRLMAIGNEHGYGDHNNGLETNHSGFIDRLFRFHLLRPLWFNDIVNHVSNTAITSCRTWSGIDCFSGFRPSRNVKLAIFNCRFNKYSTIKIDWFDFKSVLKCLVWFHSMNAI